jgi:cytidylate kinase
MNSHVAIAIDGPAASGKSTLARNLSERLGLIMVNSGQMYRAVTWRILEDGIDPRNAEAVIAALRRMNIECGVDGLNSTIRIDGTDPGEALRGEAVNRHVSAVAAIPEVREQLVALQRQYLESGHVIMEGRDIGSVVFPETPYKLYIDADPHVRAGRRVAMGEIDAVADRDRDDSRRASAPLRIAEGAAVLDTSEHSIKSGVEAAIALLETQGLRPEAL